jgi:hypothetical protein
MSEERRFRKALQVALTNDDNANLLFKFNQDQGAIPKKFKSKEQFLKAIDKLVSEGMTRNEAVNKLAKLDSFVKSKKLSSALDNVDKVKYQGIPVKEGSGGRTVFDKRKYHEKPPLALRTWADFLEDTDVLPKGFYDGFVKWANAGWDEMAKVNNRLEAKTGKKFDRGHLIPSAEGGPNTPSNVRSELASINRSKGAAPNFATPAVPIELGVPQNWVDAFYQYDLERQGMTATGLPGEAKLTSNEIAKIEQGSDPNSIINSKQLSIQQQTVQTEQSTPDLPKSHLKIVQNVGPDGRTYKPTPKPKPAPNREILAVVKPSNVVPIKPNKPKPLRNGAVRPVAGESGPGSMSLTHHNDSKGGKREALRIIAGGMTGSINRDRSPLGQLSNQMSRIGARERSTNNYMQDMGHFSPGLI